MEIKTSRRNLVLKQILAGHVRNPDKVNQTNTSLPYFRVMLSCGPKVTNNDPKVTYSEPKVTHSDPTHLPLPPRSLPEHPGH